MPLPLPAAPGRLCPLHYRYRPEDMAGPAPPALRELDVLYVAGGLYGNEPALRRLLALFERESGRKRLVFNGDFHWFDADPAVFARVQDAVLAHEALRGNVETELAAETPDDEDAGCGCAYPDWVGEGVVERSNRILQRLRGATTAEQRRALAALPMWTRADVGPLRLAVVHGDAHSLAGWGFAYEHLREPEHRARAREALARAQVHAFACSHTCLPVFQALRLDGDAAPRWVLNNGAAGMPNFADDLAGLVTRVALRPFDGPERRLGVRHNGVWLDAIALEADTTEVQAAFLRQWPEGSDAHLSYFARLTGGPDHRVTDALRRED